jgi:hypothetical protein
VCIGCLGWRDLYLSRGPCQTCRRPYLARNVDLVCRLCWRQACALRQGHQPLDYIGANRHGQQLFLADMFTRHGQHTRRNTRHTRSESCTGQLNLPVGYRQLVLLDVTRDLAGGLGRGFPPPNPAVWAVLEEAIDDHAGGHGWQPHVVEGVRRGVRILLGTQDTPGAPMRATDIDRLASIGIAARPVRDVLERLGMLEEDRTPAVETWFCRQITDLPEAMRQELRAWYDVMLLGSSTPPRRNPRSPKTMRSQLAFALPMLRAWGHSHDSLRAIARDDVLEALPASGAPRSTALQGLRSIFTVLRGKKLIFCNPTARIRGPRLDKPAPVAIDPVVLHAAFNSDDATTAALAGLIAFHALRSGQLCDLLLTDIRDRRLHLDGRAIPLAQPVQRRLRAYLDYREQRWPGTVNPHLFIHYRIATHTGPATGYWIRNRLGMNPQLVRQDRIMDEAHVTGGDTRILCDLFGLSIAGANRYTATVDHPGIAEFMDRRRR